VAKAVIGRWTSTYDVLPTELRSHFLLNVAHTQITDAGLVHVKALPQLSLLLLGGTKVTDVGMEYLGELASLTMLDLSDTQVTDIGLEHVKGLTDLKALWLWETQVTDKCVEELQQALPSCWIDTELWEDTPFPPADVE